MSKQLSNIHKLIEDLGLDWFVLLMGKQPFEDAPLPFPTSLQEIRDKFGDLTDNDKIQDAEQYCIGLIEREEKRASTIESKAVTLIGITSIAAGFITGFAGLLLDRSKISSSLILVLIGLFYILTVGSLLWTIYLSMRTIVVFNFPFTYPNAADIFDLSNKTLHAVKRERIASLFYSFVQNTKAINRKGTWLGGAQKWFRNSITLLLCVAILLGCNALFFSPLQTSNSLSTPAVQQSSTQQPVATMTPSPTLISTPIPSPVITSTP